MGGYVQEGGWVDVCIYLSKRYSVCFKINKVYAPGQVNWDNVSAQVGAPGRASEIVIYSYGHSCSMPDSLVMKLIWIWTASD